MATTDGLVVTGGGITSVLISLWGALVGVQPGKEVVSQTVEVETVPCITVTLLLM